MNTFDWLNNSLQLINDKTPITRCGREWIPVAGFKSVGCIFAIYEDENNYCAHAGDDWEINEEPLLGYFSKNLSYSELISTIAQKYDFIKENKHLYQKN